MNCVKCGSERVVVQTVPVQELKEKRHGLVYWLLIGWWWEPIAWLFLTLPKFIITIFKPKRWRTRTVMHTVAACQNCGYSWEILSEKETKKKKKQKRIANAGGYCGRR